MALVLLGILAVALLRRNGPTRVELSLPVWIVAAALVATLLQVVPLPLALVAVVSPGAHDVLTLGLGGEAGWAPLTMDTPATAHEIVKLVAYLAGALLAATLFGKPRHRRALLGWISAAGGMVVLVGFMHALAGLDRPYGTFGYAPRHFVSTFINPNHLAGFLGFCSTIALGLSLSARDGWRWLHLGNAILMGAGVFLSLSRGGIVSYVAALGFLGLLFALNRSARTRRLVWAQAGLAGALLVAGYLAYSRVVLEMWTLGSPRALAKSEIWQPVPTMLADFPALGVGRGAFWSIYPRYRLVDLPSTFTHLENEWLQALVDWGPLVGSALLLALGWAFVSILRCSTDDAQGLAVASALLFLAGHNLGDFNLEVSAVALPALMVLVVFARCGSEGSVAEPDTDARLSWAAKNLSLGAARLVVVLLAGILLAAAWPALAHGIERDTARLTRQLQRVDSTPESRARAALEIIGRHPADYVLPLLVGQRELREPDGARRALRWTNRSMYLAPEFVGSHRLAGRALWRLGVTSQALLEYRLACEKAPSQTEAIAREVLELGGKPEYVAELAGQTTRVRLAVATFLLGNGSPDQVLRVLEGATRIDEPQALEVAARAYLQLEQYDAALARARTLEKRWPERSQAYLLQSSAASKLGDQSAALAALRRGVQASATVEPILSRLTFLHLSRGELTEARRVANELLKRSGIGRSTARAHWLLGLIYDREGRKTQALRSFERARDHYPRELSYRLQIARAREALGDLPAARAELERAKVEVGTSSSLEAMLEKVESSARAREEQLRRESLLRQD